MTIKDTPFTMTITQVLDTDGSYPNIPLYWSGSITLDVDTWGDTDNTGSYLQFVVPQGFQLTYLNMPGTPSSSWRSDINSNLVQGSITLTADNTQWTTCYIAMLNVNAPSDISECEGGWNYYNYENLSVVNSTGSYGIDPRLGMIITEVMNADGTYPLILPGTQGTVTLNLDTGEKEDSAGSRLYIHQPSANCTITDVKLPSLSTTSYQVTTETDEGNTVFVVTLVDNNLAWETCELTLSMSDLMSGNDVSFLVEYYNTDWKSTSGSATIVVEAVAPIDPSKISLKGFYLDTATTNTGGTRDIFSNGVMEARIFLRWSYGGTDNNTVNNINQWLCNNGNIRMCADNNTDLDPQPEGWTVYYSPDNTSKNGDKYVFDTKVVVPPVNEDGSLLPEQHEWHLACYCTPPATQTGNTNFYFQFSYAGSDGTTKTISTINDTLMIISSHDWVFNKDNFTLREIWNGDGTGAYNSVHALEYNPETTSITDMDDFYEVCLIEKNWIPITTDPNSQDKYWPLWDQVKGGYGHCIDASGLTTTAGVNYFDGMFALVLGSGIYQNGPNEDRFLGHFGFIALIDPYITQNFLQLTQSDLSDLSTAYHLTRDTLLNEPLPEVYFADGNRKSSYKQLDDTALNLELADTGFNFDNAHGPLVMFQGEGWGSVGLWAQWTLYADDPMNGELDSGTGFNAFTFGTPTQTTKQKCTDHFGQTFYAVIAWTNNSDGGGDDSQKTHQPQYWSVSDIIPE